MGLCDEFLKNNWRWDSMIGAGVLDGFYFYAKENETNLLEDYQFSIITRYNFIVEKINVNELSKINLHTQHRLTLNEIIEYLKNPLAWYDAKVNQVYWSIHSIGRVAADFKGLGSTY